MNTATAPLMKLHVLCSVALLTLSLSLPGLAMAAPDLPKNACEINANAMSSTTLTEDEMPFVGYPERCCLKRKNILSEQELDMARIAWKYFEKNYQAKTGLVNSANQYPSTTMWDTGSSIAATLTARELEFISQKEFDDRITALLATLNTMRLFNEEAPNKAYNTLDGEMSDYNNKPTQDGIGVSTLDLARLSQWLNVLSCMHPKHRLIARQVMARWKYCRLIKNGEMYGLSREGKQIQVLQEGRLGYEQYAGKIFSRLGFDTGISKTYRNKHATATDIYGVSIPYDKRDPKDLGAYNYVVTESFYMDAMENGLDPELSPLVDNIYKVQQKRWEQTGQVTAVSEDNVDRDPWFVYNTIFVAGKPWSAITDTGRDMSQLRSVSTKAAISMALFKPREFYSKVLIDHVRSAYDPDYGWYSGVYETGLGYNKALTANTNGVILETILYRAYGPLAEGCRQCQRHLQFDRLVLEDKRYADHCLPTGQANACVNPDLCAAAPRK
ncbi:DUF3131 domain-containing protein [Pseudomethylobacillus aquaticus]|nr:DUF3131 domain-containing protein [Pseudomethylobacillus aquaticus]